MRVAAPLLSLALASTLAACSDAPESTVGETITIDTPSFTLQPGDEKFYCYYTTLPNAEATGIHRMASSMTPGSHHMIVFKTRTPQMPDGTFAECQNFGMGSGGLANIPVWLYAAQNPEVQYTMPDDVGISIAPSQPVLVNMHYINLSDQPITANVHIDLEAYKPTHTFTQAHTYVTFNTEIDVPAGAQGSAGGTCDVSPDAKFLFMTTHSHKYTTRAQVLDGDTMVLETRDWAHATVESWGSPYYSFASGKLGYRCDYNNTTTEPLRTGESAIANEMCMAAGVYFPAHGDTFCINSLTLAL
jgi:hypothetical protein